MNRPNILYIHSHDTGRYVQPYGYAVATPRIQQLAEEGVLFRQAFCAGPSCSPSRAALVTGRNPHSAGMLGLAHMGWRLNDYGQHIVNTLRANGYYGALIGFQHVIHWNHVERIGYDETRAVGGAPRAREVVPAAQDFLRNAPKQPFFLAVGIAETHRFFGGTFVTDSGLVGEPRYCRPPAPIPDTPETRRDMADFIEGAGILDKAVGDVLDELDKQGMAENTLVICTTDHGVPFPSMKCCLTDHGMGVMLIMRGPGGFSGGKVIDAMVAQIDIFPTLCEVLGIAAPDWLEGTSMMPLVSGQANETNDEVFSEVTYHGVYEPQRAVRTKRWKYIRRFIDSVTPDKNSDSGLSRKFWLRHGWQEHMPARERLYDLIFDPNEACNLADDPAFAEALSEMRRRLDAWMARTDDPLLKGDIEPTVIQKNIQEAQKAGRPLTMEMFEQ